MKCHYCLVFQECPSNLRSTVIGVPWMSGNKGKYIVSSRFCRTIKKEVLSETEICDDFKPSKTFWCNKSGYWLSLKACVYRSNNDSPDCYGCSQREEILSILRLVSINAIPKLKRRKMKPQLKSREIKPQLKRRG